MRIDFHSHIFPQSYIEHLSARKEFPYIGESPLGKAIFYAPDGFPMGIMPQGVSVEARLADADAHGIDLEVLTATIPGVDTLPIKEAIPVARRANEDIAKVAHDHPDRFVGLGLVPLQDVPAAITELEYGVKQLGLKGAGIYSNVAGHYYDSPEFLDFFSAATDLGAVIFVHPTHPAMAHAVKMDPVLMTAIAFLSDTALAIAQLILSGVFERLPNLKIVFAHLGGTFPYVVGRLDHSVSRPGRRREELTLLPSEYLKRAYLDTISMSPASLRLAQEKVGLEHLLFATDYPFIDIASNLETLEQMGLAMEEKTRVLGGNAQALLGL